MDLSDLLLRIFDALGHLVCHQLPDRTLWVGGRYLPVCARDTGAYLGLLIGYMMLPFRNRKATGPPNLGITLTMMLPLIIDGLTQFLGYRVSTNDLRLITGLLFGASLTPFLVYVLSMVSPAKKLPFIGAALPIRMDLDKVKNPWLGYRAFAIGLVAVVIGFFGIEAIIGSYSSWFYWLISSLIIFSIIIHIFILPIFLLCSIGLAKH